MKTFLVFLLSIQVLSDLFAQDGYGSTSVYDRIATLPKGRHLFVIPAMDVWDKQPWKDSVFLFENFEIGKLEMRNGFVPSHRPMLNYNILLESIDIKQPNTGDIVSMRKSPEIKTVWIGNHKFINHPTFGYLEILLNGNVSVAQKTFMNGVYELSNGNMYPFRATTDTKISSIRTTRYFWQEEQYFIIGKNSKVFRSGSGALKHLVPKQKARIKAFVKENRIDFRKKEDIVKAVAYTNEQAATEETKN